MNTEMCSPNMTSDSKQDLIPRRHPTSSCNLFNQPIFYTIFLTYPVLYSSIYTAFYTVPGGPKVKETLKSAAHIYQPWANKNLIPRRHLTSFCVPFMTETDFSMFIRNFTIRQYCGIRVEHGNIQPFWADRWIWLPSGHLETMIFVGPDVSWCRLKW